MRYVSTVVFGLGLLLVIATAAVSQSAEPIEGLLGVLLLAALASLSKFKRLSEVIATISPFLGLVAIASLLATADIFYNSFSSLTHRVRVYPVECKGKVVPGGPWGGGLCCGSLGVPLNPTTFTVSISRQQVFESILGLMERPLHNYEVQDIPNWQCTTYWDATGTTETDMAHGQCFDGEIMRNGVLNDFSSGDCLAESEASRNLHQEGLKRDSIYVIGWEWWTGQFLSWWEKGRGIWGEPPDSQYTTHDPMLCRSGG
jgi:hypothetical protein